MKKQILLASLLAALLLAGCSDEPSAQSDTQANKSSVSATQSTPEQPQEPQEPAEQTPTEPESTLTMGQQNALQSAKDYLDYSGFSYTGLIEQLEFEGYSTEDATYAADNCGADWNEQAAKSAQSYLDLTSFSRDGLIEQLVFDGFTQEQAEYGVTAVGY